MTIENAIEREADRAAERRILAIRSGKGFQPIGALGKAAVDNVEKRFFTGTCPEHGNWQTYQLCGKNSDGTWRPFTPAECPKCKEARLAAEKEAEKQKEAERKLVEEEVNKNRLKEAREAAVLRSGIPPQYLRSTLNGYAPKTPFCAESKKQAVFFVENFMQIREKGIGLFFYGPTGTGKTHLSCAVLRALIDRSGVFGLFVPAWKFLMDMNEAGFNKSAVLKPLVDAPLLVIDEIGLQGGTKAEEKHLYALIDARINANRPTIYTSNVQPDTTKKEFSQDTLRKIIGERVYDRLQWKTIFLKVDGDSHRKRYASIYDVLNDVESQK